MERPGRRPEDFEDHAKLMIDLQVIAFQTDMTRVITFMLGARGQQPQLPQHRHLRRAPLDHASPERSGEDREGRQDRRVPGADVRLFPGEAESHARWRRHAARPLADSLRQRLWRRQHPHASRSADGRAGRRRGQLEGRPPPDYPKETPLNNLLVNMLDKAGVPHGQFRRRHRRIGTSHRYLAGAVQEHYATEHLGPLRRDGRAGVRPAWLPPICVWPMPSSAATVRPSTSLLRADGRRQRGAARWRDRAGLGCLSGRPRVGRAAARGRRQREDRRRIWRDAAHAGRRQRQRGAGEKLLKAGADAEVGRWNGETALMIAANAGSVEAVKQLIARGANVNAAEPRKGQTALMWAAAEGHPDVVQVLIEHRRDVNAASKSGFTALVFAAVKNDPKSIQKLLAAGADANFALPDGTKNCWWRRRTRAWRPLPRLLTVAPTLMLRIARAIRRCIQRRRQARSN